MRRFSRCMIPKCAEWAQLFRNCDKRVRERYIDIWSITINEYALDEANASRTMQLHYSQQYIWNVAKQTEFVLFYLEGYISFRCTYVSEQVEYLSCFGWFELEKFLRPSTWPLTSRWKSVIFRLHSRFVTINWNWSKSTARNMIFNRMNQNWRQCGMQKHYRINNHSHDLLFYKTERCWFSD